MNRYYKLAIFLAYMLIFSAQVVRAEGPGTGGSRIFAADKQTGDFVLTVWAGPSPPQVGRYTVYVRVNDKNGNQLRDGLQVDVTSEEETTGNTTRAEANHQNAGNSLDYAAHFNLENQGNYKFVVRVSNGQNTAGTTEFRERVVATIGIGLISAIAGPFIVLIGAVFWFLWGRKGSKSLQEGEA